MWSFPSAHRWKILLEEEVEGNAATLFSPAEQWEGCLQAAEAPLLSTGLTVLSLLQHKSFKAPFPLRDLVNPEHGLEKPYPCLSLSATSLCILTSLHSCFLVMWTTSSSVKQHTCCPFSSLALGSLLLPCRKLSYSFSALNWSPISSEKQPHTHYSISGTGSLPHPGILTASHLRCDMHAHVCTMNHLMYLLPLALWGQVWFLCSSDPSAFSSVFDKHQQPINTCSENMLNWKNKVNKDCFSGIKKPAVYIHASPPSWTSLAHPSPLPAV